MPFIGLTLPKITDRRDLDALDYLNSRTDIGVNCPPKIVYHQRTLLSLQLHIIKFVVINARNDVLRHVICKDSHALYTTELWLPGGLSGLLPITVHTIVRNDSGQTGYHLHIAWRVRTEVKAHHINVQGFQLAYVFSVTNTAYFNQKRLFRFHVSSCFS